MMSTLLSLLLLAGSAFAQNASYLNTSSISPTTTLSGGSVVANPSAFVTSMDFSVEDLWDLFVGPISSANITTTVSPTPVPASSLIPPPFLNSFAFPPGRQYPLETKNESWSFPKDFILGVSGAAYQVEGATKDEGKGPSIWDALTHRAANYVVDNSTGDITDNHYYLYKQDIARIAAIGATHYSFSIAWTRILPFGTGAVNELGIAHYNDVIDTCLQYNITPMATLYHWDLPLVLQNKYGGWMSEEIVGDFVEYARIAYAAFGDRVKYWYTINEPHEVCLEYPYPPHIFKNYTIPSIEQPYVCGRNIILAHAEAYHLGKAMIPDSLITFKNNGGGKIPLTNSSADAEAVDRAWDFVEGWFATPVFLTGDYPSTLNDYVSTFLTPFTAEQKTMINGSADYFAHDAYTSSFYFAPDAGIASCLANSSNPLYPLCFNTSQTYPASLGGWDIGPAAQATWLKKATDWVPGFLQDINSRFHPAGGIAITEFGFSEPFEASKTILADILFDTIRASYFHDYMEAILIALSDGINVLGVSAWSFVDNLEWTSGFATRFGMQYVNLTTQERYFKASFFQYVDIYQTYLEQ